MGNGGIGRASVPSAQEKVVVSRSGNACAYPECGIELTMEPRHPSDRPKATGKVAHICAASPGGPRFNEKMTDAQRGSANNLIYLCGPHHDMIDAQLHFHTTEYLHTAKKQHEAKVTRAMQHVLGRVTFDELEVVCAVIGLAPSSEHRGEVELALPLQEKIDFNELGEPSVRRITDGLSQSTRVASFISFQNGIAPGFGRQLAARMKVEYLTAQSTGLTPDEVFDYVVQSACDNAGPRDSPQLRAAALAVVAYLFELCEIFEHA